MTMSLQNIGFIGLGLIGGSIAKAAKKNNPATKIVAYDVDINTLLVTQAEGSVDIACVTIDSTFSECDCIFLCAPVISNASYLGQLKPFLKEDCILTDVGSVKGDIHQAIAQYGLSAYFVGGHPMTGSEKSGYRNANARLFENAYYILTPAPESSADAIERLKTFVSAIGAIPFILDATTHDYATAGISHLPHIIAAALVDYVHSADSADELMRTLAAGGFKDITRIASSSPQMWQDICLSNAEQIASLLSAYINLLSSICADIKNRDAAKLYQLFEQAKDYRDSMPDAAFGPIKKAYVLYCDIPDETGIIAKIATLLAKHSISIKNIGIIHNREFDEGALKIEFYDETSFQQALYILPSHGYSIHGRK